MKPHRQETAMKLTIVAGARPNFVKIAPIIHAVKSAQGQGESIEFRLVHTGQHYDHKMSNSFFEELNIPEPDINLGVGSGTASQQTAAIMVAFETDLNNHPSDIVIVVGDVNSTMACAIVAKKLQTKVAHVEAGIRSFDLSMPEEINRMVTDSITDYFFTTSKKARNNLMDLGIPDSRIFFVGNVMIDTLIANIKRLEKPDCFDDIGLKTGGYFVVTMHRPANVDEEDKLHDFLKSMTANVNRLPVVFPVHPRTKKTLEELEIDSGNLFIVEPLSYLNFNYLVKHSMAVITDSGGITEETTVMGIPCMTLRDNTERPETVTEGTNVLVGTDPKQLNPHLQKLFAGEWKKGKIPELWDGNAADRIVDKLIEMHR
jgi:UDP-N-acetylglucosamine 2-epimerase (non-hydrolysing)